MSWTLLHVSNFHIGADAQRGNPLSQAFYREYISSFGETLRQTSLGDVQAIIATGDFVERGQAESFTHAANVLDRLADELGVPLDRVVVCPGNHDVDREIDQWNPERARFAFGRFSERYGNRSSLCSQHDFAFHTPDETLSCIAIDSTFGSSRGRPRQWTLDFIGRVGYVVEKHCGKGLLVIATHYPILPGPLRVDDTDYFERHFSPSGAPLLELVQRARPDLPTLILTGDCHFPFTHREDSLLQVSTSGFGGDLPGRYIGSECEARLICVDSSTVTFKSARCVFRESAHALGVGRWVMLPWHHHTDTVPIEDPEASFTDSVVEMPRTDRLHATSASDSALAESHACSRKTHGTQSPAPRVFISYSHSDKRVVERLRRYLQDHNIEVWIDEVELSFGDPMIESLRMAIDSVDAVIAVLSTASVGSRWVLEELELAMTRQVNDREFVVVPVVIEDCHLPGFLASRFYADFTTKHLRRKNRPKLLEAIRERSRGQQ